MLYNDDVTIDNRYGHIYMKTDMRYVDKNE